MSTFICSLTNQQCKNPVFTKDGHVYERNAIEKHIASVGTDPFSNQPLSTEDLIGAHVQPSPASQPPRPANLQSIPQMLEHFQLEWDAVMLETFQLKQQLHTTRQELAHSLYQHDAACRVIARLIKERDQYKTELLNIRATYASRGASGDAMDVDQGALPGLPADLKTKILNHGKELAGTRANRQISASLAPKASIQQYNQTQSQSVHSTSAPGVLALDIHPSVDKEHLILTGGVDKTAVIYNKNTQKKEATLSGHSKPVVCVKFHPESSTVVYTASTDATARMWYFEPEKSDWNSHTIKVHTHAVTGLDVHCTGDLFVTASSDRSWALHDARQGRSYYRCVSEKVEAGLSAVKIHPDGIIMATGGDDNIVNVWDIRTGKAPKARFEGHSGAITSVAFNENGFFMASASQDRSISLWDLRTQKKLQSIALDEVAASVSYDFSGKYLAAAVGAEVRVYTKGQKTDSGSLNYFEHVQSFDGHTKKVTDVKFGADALWLASTSMDRTLKIFS